MVENRGSELLVAPLLFSFASHSQHQPNQLNNQPNQTKRANTNTSVCFFPFRFFAFFLWHLTILSGWRARKGERRDGPRPWTVGTHVAVRSRFVHLTPTRIQGEFSFWLFVFIGQYECEPFLSSVQIDSGVDRISNSLLSPRLGRLVLLRVGE